MVLGVLHTWYLVYSVSAVVHGFISWCQTNAGVFCHIQHVGVSCSVYIRIARHGMQWYREELAKRHAVQHLCAGHGVVVCMQCICAGVHVAQVFMLHRWRDMLRILR